MAVTSCLEILSISSQFPFLVQAEFQFPCDSPYKVGPYFHVDKLHCIISNTIHISASFVSLKYRLTKRVLQLESILEGIVSQVDAVGSKLKMLESKGDLAPSPGMVRSFSWVLCSVREDSLERLGEQCSQWSQISGGGEQAQKLLKSVYGFL